MRIRRLVAAVLGCALLAGFLAVAPTPLVQAAGAIPGGTPSTAPTVCSGGQLGPRNWPATPTDQYSYVRIWVPANATVTIVSRALFHDANGNAAFAHGLAETNGVHVYEKNWGTPYYHGAGFEAGETRTWTNTGSSRYMLGFNLIDIAVSVESVSYWTTFTVTAGDGTTGAICSTLAAGEMYGPNPALANPCCQGWAADPVNTHSGNFHDSFTDLGFGGRGPALEWVRSYNSADVATTGAFGSGWRSTYELSLAAASGSATIVQETGARVTFDQLSDGTWGAPPRVTAKLVKNVDNTWTFTRNHGAEVFTFDSAGTLIAVADRNGEAVTLAYTSGRLSSITDDAGRSIAVTWNTTTNRITAISDSSTPARSVTYGYNGAGELTSVVDVGGGTTGYGYEAGNTHRMTTVTSPEQSADLTPESIVNSYDGSGRVAWQEDELGRRTTFTYDTDHTSIEHPDGDVTIDWYQGPLRWKQTIAAGTPDEASWEFTYDAATLGITSITDPDVQVTTMTYDAAGNRLTTTDPLLRTATTTYNAQGQPLTKTVGGVTTTFTYDSAGNLASTSTPLLDGASVIDTQDVTFHRDDVAHPGDVTSVTDPRGETWTYGYDAAGNQTSSTDPLGNETTWQFDDIGRPVELVDAAGNASGATAADHTTTFEYDALGLLEATTDQLGNRLERTYDANGNVLTSTDANAHVTTYTYDDADQLIDVERPDGSTLTTSYRADGAIEEQVDGSGAVTAYDYDAAGRVVTTTDPNNRVTAYDYDDVGRLLTLTDPESQVTTYGYDVASQTTSIDYSDAGTSDVTAITYDGLGRRTSTTMSNSVVSTWAWDSLGRLTESTTTGNDPVAYGYDIAGNLTSIDDGGREVVRTYDAAGRMDSSTDWNGQTTSFDHDANGNLVETAFPSGSQVDSYAYDRANRLVSTTVSAGATTLASLTYGRDDVGLLTSETPTGALGTTATTYGYDELDQLTTRDGVTAWAYDPADNLTVAPGTTGRAYDGANQLCWSSPTAAGGDCNTAPSDATVYGYDGRGNRTSSMPANGDIPSTYGYDQANRMVSATVPTAVGDTGQYKPLAQTRVMDTRAATRTGDCGGGAVSCTTFAAGNVRTLQITGAGGVPASGVDAVMVTVAATNSANVGWVTAYPNGTSTPGTANLLTAAGTTAVSTAIVKVGTSGRISLFASVGTDVTVDVNGWYASPTSQTTGNLFHTVAPTRIMSTPTASGSCAGGCTTLTAGAVRTLQVTGTAGVPAGATAVVLNVIAGNQTAAGFVTAYPTGGTQPLAANLVFQAGKQVSNLVVVGLSSDGKVSFYNGVGSADLVVDIQGYFTAASSGEGTGFTAASPQSRILSTSPSTGTCTPGPCARLAANSTVTAQVTGLGGVPAGATAVVLGVSALNTSAAGYVTVYAADQSAPFATNLAASGAAQNLTETVTVPLSSTGAIKIATVGMATDLLLDVQGWYLPATQTWTYGYDADGNRLSKTGPAGSTTFSWNVAGGLPMLLHETTGSTTTSYLYGPDGRAYAQIATMGGVDTTTYLHHDQLGSTRLLTDAAGTVVGTASYDPYGKVATTSGVGSSVRLGWAGEYRDAETGFTYLRARYYDPLTGSFISRDPLVALTGAAYGYAANQPTNLTDPSGLFWGEGVLGDVADFFTGDGCDGGLFGAIGDLATGVARTLSQNAGHIAFVASLVAYSFPGFNLVAIAFGALSAYNNWQDGNTLLAVLDLLGVGMTGFAVLMSAQGRLAAQVTNRAMAAGYGYQVPRFELRVVRFAAWSRWASNIAFGVASLGEVLSVRPDPEAQ